MGRNKKLLRKVADYIEANPKKYNQNYYLLEAGAENAMGDVEETAYNVLKFGAECDTKCCVAGWSVFLGLKEAPDTDTTVHTAAKEVLGLSYSEADWLFEGERNEKAMPSVLRFLADGGHIDDAAALEDVLSSKKLIKAVKKYSNF